MADTSKKTTRTKKPAAAKSAVPTAKAVAAEAKPKSTPAAVKTAVKPTLAPAPAPAPAVKPAAVAAPVPATPKVEQKTISKAERQRLVEQAAYFRAEKHGFQGDSSQHWSAAEAEIDADLRKRNVRVV